MNISIIETVKYLLERYIDHEYLCHMSFADFKYLEHILLFENEFRYCKIIMPFTTYAINNLRFSTPKDNSNNYYIKTGIIYIYRGPCIAKIEILTDDQRLIKDIIE